MRVFFPLLFCVCAFLLAGCSTNPATGARQFTALMSPQEEIKVGAEEHRKIKQQFGFYDDEGVAAYVRAVGARVVEDTERPDVTYKFFVLDSPIVNAFALPGGYIYVSRGLLALANSEAELAAVLAHEAGHITARHSAERYSHSVLTSLGTTVLSTVIGGGAGVGQALGLGSDLYLSSYSRGQESEADRLGVRYLVRGGYDPQAMQRFLESLQASSDLQAKIDGKSSKGFSYFSTHPATQDRVIAAGVEAEYYAATGDVKRDQYLEAMDGLTFGDSAAQGFVKDGRFVHPKIGFMFDVPDGFRVINQPSQVIVAAKDKSGALMVFDMISGADIDDPEVFLKESWLKGKDYKNMRRTQINGMQSVMADIEGQVDNKAMKITLVAVRWNDDVYARFQIALPVDHKGDEALDALSAASKSLSHLSDDDKERLKPQHVRLVTARAGDTVYSLARRQVFETLQDDHFRVLNGLKEDDPLVAGRTYKLIVQ